MSDTQLLQGMDDRVFEGLCQLIYQHSRICLTSEKKSFLCSRLERHKRELQADSWGSYLDKLVRAPDVVETENVIDLVSTNHTYFFREPSHFERLSQDLLATVIKNHSAKKSLLQCWSVAASSGEEAFSLAITLAEYERAHGAIGWYVHATDISRRVLIKAHASIYNIDQLNLPSTDLLTRYFQKGTGEYEGQCKVKHQLIQRVKFAHANVFQPTLPVPEHLDIIFCRNVLIYFDTPSRQLLITRLENMLEPGGLLLIGHTENLSSVSHKLQHLGGGIFRRPH
jgi:chemotaxis protein methyltransferase CheR